jgi:hypothetical protein
VSITQTGAQIVPLLCKMWADSGPGGRREEAKAPSTLADAQVNGSWSL